MRVVKTNDTDIHIQIMENQTHEKKLIMVKIGDGVCWQEITLPSEIVKEKFTDATFWKHILNFFIKE